MAGGVADEVREREGVGEKEGGVWVRFGEFGELFWEDGRERG